MLGASALNRKNGHEGFSGKGRPLKNEPGRGHSPAGFDFRKPSAAVIRGGLRRAAFIPR